MATLIKATSKDGKTEMIIRRVTGDVIRHTIPNAHFERIKGNFDKPAKMAKGTLSLNIERMDQECGEVVVRITHKHKDQLNDTSDRLLNVVSALDDYFIDAPFYTGDMGVDDAYVKIDYFSLDSLRKDFKKAKASV